MTSIMIDEWEINRRKRTIKITNDEGVRTFEVSTNIKEECKKILQYFTGLEISSRILLSEKNPAIRLGNLLFDYSDIIREQNVVWFQMGSNIFGDTITNVIVTEDSRAEIAGMDGKNVSGILMVSDTTEGKYTIHIPNMRLKNRTVSEKCTGDVLDIIDDYGNVFHNGKGGQLGWVSKVLFTSCGIFFDTNDIRCLRKEKANGDVRRIKNILFI